MHILETTKNTDDLRFWWWVAGVLAFIFSVWNRLYFMRNASNDSKLSIAKEKEVRKRFFELDYKTISDIWTGKVLTKINKWVDAEIHIFHSIRAILLHFVFKWTILIGMMIFYEPWLAVVMILTFIIMFIGQRIFASKVDDIQNKLSDIYENSSKNLVRCVSEYILVRLSNSAEREQQDLDKIAKDRPRLDFQNELYQYGFYDILHLCIKGMEVSMRIYLGLLIINGTKTIAELTLITSIIRTLRRPIESLLRSIWAIIKDMPYYKNLQEFLNTPKTISDWTSEFVYKSWEIEIKNVSFGYRNGDLDENVGQKEIFAENENSESGEKDENVGSSYIWPNGKNENNIAISSEMSETNEVDKSLLWKNKNGKTTETMNLKDTINRVSTLFNNFSMDIQWWKTTAIVWHSGSGKSTLIKLLLRLFDVNSGKIVIDWQNLKDLKLSSYYIQIGYLSQEPAIFDGTIWENLVYGLGDDVLYNDSVGSDFWSDLEENGNAKNGNAKNGNAKNGNAKNGNAKSIPLRNKINSIIKLAKCEFIYDLQDGINTEIGERGVKLSGGEKQRIAIARIFLKNPKILILDEPTSALDSIAENQITQAIQELMKHRTVIVIAHRLQTVQNADIIYVLEKWKIMEKWNHNELIWQDGIYKTLVDLQQGIVKE